MNIQVLVFMSEIKFDLTRIGRIILGGNAVLYLENEPNSKIAVCFLWLSLPGHYRVTDEALLAETRSMTHLLSHECFIDLKGTIFYFYLN